MPAEILLSVGICKLYFEILMMIEEKSCSRGITGTQKFLLGNCL